MTRRAHRIWRTRAPRFPIRAVAAGFACPPLDATDDDSLLIFAASAIAGASWRKEGGWVNEPSRRQRDPDEFWRAVERSAAGHDETLLVACDWGGVAPIIAMSEQLAQRGWDIQGEPCLADPVWILRYKRDGKRLVILDTRNWLRGSMGEAAEAVGVEYRDDDPPADQSAALEWADRRAQATLAVFLAWVEEVRGNRWGTFKPTLASQAAEFFARTHGAREMFFEPPGASLEMARAALFGGRVMCRHQGEYRGMAFKVDMNSMYPHVMREWTMPISRVTVTRQLDYEMMAKRLKRRVFIVEGRFRFRERRFPFRSAEGITYPIGDFDAVLAHPEFMEIWATGDVLAVQRVAIYEAGAPFGEFVDRLYPLKRAARAAGNHARAAAAKVMLNALYGKFAQQGISLEAIGECEPNACWRGKRVMADTGEVLEIVQWGGVEYALRREAEAANSHPAIAACVTSAGRVLLWRAIEMAGMENTLYADTDAVIVTEAGWRRLGSPKQAEGLGEWKLEAAADDAIFHGPQHYEMAGERKISGLRRSARSIGDGVYREIKATRIGEWMAAGGQIAARRIEAAKIMRRETPPPAKSWDAPISDAEFEWLCSF